MKKISLFLILLLPLFILLNTVFAGDVWVDGYIRNDGTYVRGHHRSTPDSNPWNNYSTKGNANPYTGKPGYIDPYKSYYPDPYKSKPSRNNLWNND